MDGPGLRAVDVIVRRHDAAVVGAVGATQLQLEDPQRV